MPRTEHALQHPGERRHPGRARGGVIGVVDSADLTKVSIEATADGVTEALPTASIFGWIGLCPPLNPLRSAVPFGCPEPSGAWPPTRTG